MPAHPKTSTKGRYRQVRFTFTQEANGRCSVSLYAKPMNAAWHERQCLARYAVQMNWPLDTLEDCLAALVLVIEEQMLPLAGPADSE